ncbi:MAG TPA: response regulator [Steroidobacteraceae bacterium]|nr:response regulator [Steroidobacteraceae bacterium]
MNAASLTILNVDDTAASRYTKSRILRQAGYTVVEADNGTDAVRLARELLPALVVMDVRLPDMSGIDACRKIKADPATRSIPVVQISATFVTPQDQLLGLEGGAEIYLTEPVEPVELTTAVRVLLRLHSIERGLVQSEARWRSFVDSNIIGVIILKNGRFLEVNDTFLRMTGYAREELVGSTLTWRSLTAPESLERSEAAAAELRMRGTCAPFEKEYLRKDGSRVWGMTTATLIHDAEDQWMAFVLDISDRKHAALEREAAFAREHAARTQAEEATRLKDEFLANLSHELRTPMNAIIGWSHLLRSGRLEESQRQRALESIDRGARSQAKLIEDLLDVSRIVSGKLSLNMQPVDLASVIDAALEIQRPAAQAKGLKLERGAAPAEFTVMGDASRLQQVFLNILANAVKFTPAGGQVHVELTAKGGETEVAISDTGEGISAEFLPYVFDRFRQADGTSTRTHMGLGLGLAIVRHVVELHGGTVRVASPGIGKGATFTVTLPAATGVESTAVRKPLPERMPGAYPAAGGLGIRVLIVEDDAETRDILAAILERSGFSYRLATRAGEALSMLDEWLPDAIVSDIAMPDVDGYELMRQLRARPPHLGGSIPALALTAYARAADRELALRAGYQAHVAKPVNPVDLVRAITELTGRSVSPGDAQM